MKLKLILFILILIIVFTINIFEHRNMIQSKELVEENGTIIVQFCDIENCSDTLVKLTEAAKQVECAFYNLKDEQLKKIFKDKNSKILIYEKNYEEFGKKVTSKGLMHNKICVFDDDTITTGSYNPGESEKRDNQIIITSKTLAENYKKEINQLETRKETETPHTEIKFNNASLKNYFCPRDGCKEKILLEINKSNKSIYFLTFTFTDKDIAKAILTRNETGSEIKGIIEDFQNKKEWVYPLFKEFPKEIILAKTKLQHNKIIIIDNKTVITGSYNPTNAANTINDENILIIEEPEIVNKYLDYFEYVFTLEASLEALA